MIHTARRSFIGFYPVQGKINNWSSHDTELTVDTKRIIPATNNGDDVLTTFEGSQFQDLQAMATSLFFKGAIACRAQSKNKLRLPTLRCA